MRTWIGSVVISLCLFASAVYAAPQQKTESEKKTESPEAKKAEQPPEKPFADVIKDAKPVKGLFTLYQTDEKVFLEILPDQLDKIYMLSLTCESGLGEGGFYGAQMCGQTPVVFHKQGKNIQLIARNTRFLAGKGLPVERAVARSFSDSILATAALASLPQPERHSLLIDLSDIFLTDLPMMAYALNDSFRIPYHFDAKNSSFSMVKSFEGNVELETIAHYAVDQPPLPPLLPPGAPKPPMPPPPQNLPDVRSLLLHFRYSLSEPPPPGFRPRLADDRVGHFFTQIEDYSTDTDFETTKRYITRWRLEKQDPSAPLSPPKEPIVYWLENTIPVQYRDAMREGILLWNKAFERIGFKDAIVVKQQPDNADWDAADVRYHTLRWFAGYPEPGFAEGPSAIDPRTGEIYDADIRFDAGMTRFFRREKDEYINPASAYSPDPNSTLRPFLAPWHVGSSQFCDYTQGAALDAEFSFGLLVSRGMNPNGPDADKFIHDYLVEITAHEVGHTLGLRHNFRASTIHTLDEASDSALMEKDGLTGSVMDYIPTNIAPRGVKQGPYHQTTLGPYDYWAIEYAYKPIDASSTEAELPELQKIASRAAEPDLAYDTDENAGIGGGAYDMDPLVNRFDYGKDPLQYYSRRVVLADEVWGNMEKNLEKPGEGYQILRRSFNIAFGQAGYSLYLASKYIGGVYQYRSHVGDPGNRVPFVPVPVAQQKRALEILRKDLLSPDSFKFSPELLNKLASPSFPNWYDMDSMLARYDLPVHEMVLGLQNSVLDRLYDPIVLSRILDSEVKVANPSDAFTVAELFDEVQGSVWAELKSPGESLDINTYRRSLQRAHLRKLVAIVLHTTSVPEDAQTMARQNLVALRSQISAALAKPGLKTSVETRAHLSESLSRIDDALKANMQRTAF
ncbi:MAG TPA: zinc-dependent metalloprotease [Terriglobales bacterium]|nr:zinc-dependent metalloprotease [Terriglobales bacterium]